MAMAGPSLCALAPTRDGKLRVEYSTQTLQLSIQCPISVPTNESILVLIAWCSIPSTCHYVPLHAHAARWSQLCRSKGRPTHPAPTCTSPRSRSAPRLTSIYAHLCGVLGGVVAGLCVRGRGLRYHHGARTCALPQPALRANSLSCGAVASFFGSKTHQTKSTHAREHWWDIISGGRVRLGAAGRAREVVPDAYIEYR